VNQNPKDTPVIPIITLSTTVGGRRTPILPVCTAKCGKLVQATPGKFPAAETAITDVDSLTVSSTDAYSDTVPAGEVISQDPVGGTSVLIGSNVEIVVSLGPLPKDDFNDNRRGAMWRRYYENYDNMRVSEDANRLNIIGEGEIDLLSFCVAHWKMNDNDAGTTVLDSSSSGNNGTAKQSTSALHADSGNPPYLNGALTFNRSSDYITTTMTNFPSGAAARSVSLWIKWNGVGTYQVIFGYGTNADGKLFGAFLDPSGNLYCWNAWTGAGNYDTGIDIASGQWTYIVLTYDGTNVRAYKNATLINTTARALNTVLEASAIGRNYWGGGDSFGGTIDNMMIFDKELSQDEIDLLYNSANGTEDIPDGIIETATADYTSNGWSLDTTEDFAVKVDFHYSDLSSADGWAGITVADGDSYVSISAGSDNDGSYFYYEALVDGNVVSEKESRSVDDGTLYVSYDATLNEVYLSRVDYGSTNAYTWSTIPYPLQGQWTDASVKVAVGGGCSVALASGEAYLDNLIISDAKLLGWPPVTDLNGDDYIDLADLGIIAYNWLEPDAGIEGGDINDNGIGDGIVNLRDFAELGLAW